jgi:hypothetical protein
MGGVLRELEDSNLALLYQEKTAAGQKSNFNKLVSRATAEPMTAATTARAATIELSGASRKRPLRRRCAS